MKLALIIINIKSLSQQQTLLNEHSHLLMLLVTRDTYKRHSVLRSETRFVNIREIILIYTYTYKISMICLGIAG